MVKPPILRKGLSGKRQTPGWLAVLVSIGILFCAALAGIALFSPVLNRQDMGNFAATASQYSVIDAGISITGFAVLIIFLTFAWVRFYEKRQFASLGIAQNSLNKLHRGILAGLFTVTLLTTFLIVFFDASVTIVLPQYPPAALLLSLILLPLAWFLQAISEEVLFRGFLLQSLGLNYGLPIAAVLASALFAGLHFEDGGSGAAYFIGFGILGVSLCLYTVFDNSLWGPIGFNLTWNFALYILFGVTLIDSGREEMVIYNALSRAPKVLTIETTTSAFSTSFIAVAVVLLIVMIILTVNARLKP
ncbi:MAG: CPBP family intramembrane metalloprotease [Aquisalinus sp.]|nr:CPBP family intramembrane metalloprotease [Aquisalinus sp.]